jgi:hypothetical protein
MSLDAEVYDVLEYLLRAVGDTTIEGEAAALAHKLRDVQQLPYSEDHPAKVSDEYGDPRARLESARAAANAANLALQAAEAAAGQTPAGTVAAPPATPVTSDATVSDTTPAPSFSATS